MIDYLALALGHGLLVIAMLRLVLRDGLDVDPLLEHIKGEAAANRRAISAASRNAARRACPNGDNAAEPDHDCVVRAEQR